MLPLAAKALNESLVIGLLQSEAEEAVGGATTGHDLWQVELQVVVLVAVGT